MKLIYRGSQFNSIWVDTPNSDSISYRRSLGSVVTLFTCEVQSDFGLHLRIPLIPTPGLGEGSVMSPVH